MSAPHTCVVGSFDLTGELQKQGRGLRLSFLRPWTRRHVVLIGASRTLDYFEPGSIIRKGGLILDPASSCSVVSPSSLPAGHHFVFEVVTSGGKITLAASDAQARERWMQCIEIAINPPIGFLNPVELKVRLENNLLTAQVRVTSARRITVLAFLLQ